MTDISATLVKELREATSAGMMDCKRALQETEGDFDAAVTLLRERGIASAAKRSDRETSEGKVGVRVDGGAGTLVAVGCETEPVSNNEEFLRFAESVLHAVHERGQDAVPELEDERLQVSSKLRENIQVVGAARFDGADGEALAQYVHPPAHKVGALVKVRGGSPELARDLAMHLTFAKPTYARREDVPAELVEAEKAILANLDEVQSKPENVREKIVEGMLNKRFYGEAVLLEQPWFRETATTVGKVLGEAGMELVDHAWFSVS